MANPYADLQALSVRRVAAAGPTLRPPRRWLSRVILPAVLLAGFGGLVAWSSLDLLLPRTPVTVTPVTARQAVIEAAGVELFSATGWVEPNPTPVEVAALAEGVVEQLLVLPGQRVEANQAVARLIDLDARLSLEAARRELEERRLKVETARADVDEATAQLHGAEAAVRVDEELLKNKVIGSARYEQTLAHRGVAQARIAQAKARLEEAQARVRQGEIAVQTAALRLERMTVRSPVAGVVMSLNAIPGRVVGARMMAGQADSLVTLYDPQSLQVRVEVPIDKFRLVRPGQRVTIEVDVASGQKLPGVVLYDTHETDIQRNTVRVKVSLIQAPGCLVTWPLPCWQPAAVAAEGKLRLLCDAHDALTSPRSRIRPGMIARVRVLGTGGAEAQDRGGEVLRVFIPKRLVARDGGQAYVWVVDQAAGTARRRAVTLGPESGDVVEVTEGLQPSEKLIVGGREGLQPGQRVRVTGEES